MMNCVCGKDNCNGLCEISKGMRLALLMKKAGTLQTRIGEEATPDLKGNRYRYTGIVLYAKEEDGRVCKPSAEFIHKQLTAFTSNPLATLKVFRDTGMQGLDDVIEKTKSIMNNDEIFYPIKVGNSVKYLDEYGDAREGKITKVTISLDESGELTYKLHVVGKGDAYNFLVSEYCKKFWLSNIESSNVKDEKNGRIINMTASAFINPICFKFSDEIKEKKSNKVNNVFAQVLIDNTSIYLRSGGVTKEIARLGNLAKGEGIDELEELIGEPKIYKAIKSNLQYILSHQIWIAPLGYAEEFEVTLK